MWESTQRNYLVKTEKQDRDTHPINIRRERVCVSSLMSRSAQRSVQITYREQFFWVFVYL